jgi:hypothetical protein
MRPELTSRNDDETTMRTRTRCAICGTEFEPIGRQRFDRPACRQAAWRRRHPTPLPLIPARAPRHSTVYQCGSCETRYLGEQYCDDCGRFCQRVGVGGLCPSCDEPVAVADLLPDTINLEVNIRH